MRVCGLQRLDDSLCLDKWPINQPTNYHPYTLSPSVDLVWSGYMRWFDFDSMVNRNLRLAARFDARPTHSTLPADILRRTRNPPTQWLLSLTWLNAARPTHSIPLPALHFIDIAATSESHSWLLTLVIALSTQLVRFLHCWDFLAFGSCICFEEQLPYTAIHWDLSDTHQAISFDNSGCKLSTHTHWLSSVSLVTYACMHYLPHTSIPPCCC